MKPPMVARRLEVHLDREDADLLEGEYRRLLAEPVPLSTAGPTGQPSRSEFASALLRMALASIRAERERRERAARLVLTPEEALQEGG